MITIAKIIIVIAAVTMLINRLDTKAQAKRCDKMYEEYMKDLAREEEKRIKEFSRKG